MFLYIMSKSIYFKDFERSKDLNKFKVIEANNFTC